MTITADDYAERQAVIKACSTLVERLKSILQTPTQEQSAKVALWRLGLEQAIGISGRGARFVGLKCGGDSDRVGAMYLARGPFSQSPKIVQSQLCGLKCAAANTAR